MKKTMRNTPEGTRDLLFEECLARREVEYTLTGLFRQRGFSEVMTPGIEFFDVFQGGGAVMPAESMYKLSDNKGRLLVMRPDSTTPIARLVAARLQQAPRPIRLFYAQDVYHLNHGLSGHNDQEFQAGVELIGAGGERADLEVLSLAAESLRRCAAGDYRIEIGHVGIFRALAAELSEDEGVRAELHTCIETKNYAALADLLDAMPAGGAVDAMRRLPRLFGGEEVLAAAEPLCRSEEMRAALAYLQRLYRALCRLGLGGQVMIDLGLVHRNDYYTGVIFRGYMEGSGETVVSGGRYDHLLQEFGPPLPATGFGVNVDALTKGMLAAGGVQPPAPPDVLVHAEAGCETEALQKAAELAGDGQVAECSVFDGLEEAKAYAAARGIGRVLVIRTDGARECREETI